MGYRYTPPDWAKWRTDEIPSWDDGRLVMVVLREDCGIEHYGAPAIVTVYEIKLKTTVHPTRIDRPQVLRWKLMPGQEQRTED